MGSSKGLVTPNIKKLNFADFSLSTQR